MLESGCTKTVCGEEWLRCYIDTLSEIELKFGDGKSVLSERCVDAM